MSECRTVLQSHPCQTRESESRKKISLTFSTASGGQIRLGRAKKAAPGWGCRSQSGSLKCTEAPLMSKASRVRVRSFTFAFLGIFTRMVKRTGCLATHQILRLHAYPVTDALVEDS